MTEQQTEPLAHQETLARYQSIINDALEAYQKKVTPTSPELNSAVSYMLLNPGKRLRPVLCFAFAEMFGGSVETALPLAMAVEMIHCYSLIHDDLPAMDDDELRRGKPSCHVAFDEATAILAGDALLTEAFTLCTWAKLPADKLVLAIRALGESAGKQGMVGGQAMELAYEQSSETLAQDQERDLILQIEMLKTGMLLGIPCYLGALCGLGTPELRSFIMGFGHCLGSAFQLQDDILDATGSTEVLGKPSGSDAAGEKKNFCTVFGLEQAQEQMEKSSHLALATLAQFPQPEFLQWLVSTLMERDH